MMKKIFTSFMTVATAAVLSASAWAAPLEFTANAINSNTSGVSEKVPAGGSFENATKFPNINLTPAEYGWTVNGSTLSLTSDKGYSKEIDVNHMFYDFGEWGGPDVIVNVGLENITESGVYTLHIPANFFTLDDNGNEAQELTWTYTNTASQGGGDEVTLKVNSLTINGADLMTTGKLAQLQRDDAIEVKIDPIADAAMVVLTFKDEDGGIIRTMEVYDKAGSTADPATGTYTTSVAGRAVNKFFNDKNYTLTVMAYSSNNVNNPANRKWGPVDIPFAGDSEAYKFSDAKFVSVSPDANSEITDVTTPVIVTFSSPVESVECTATTGGQGAETSTFTDITPNADKTVWTIKPGKYFWSNSGAEWTFIITAKDAEGRVVEGNNGVEEGSYYSVIYGCYLTWPEVNITPGTGMVEELYEFSVTEPRGIGFSYTSTPYVINAEGETVARADMNSQVQYDAQGRDISTLPMGDYVAVKSVFHLTTALTEPGKYTLIIPRASFAMGSQYDSDQNRYMEIEYQVVPMVAVNVELVNFAKTSFKVAKDNDATVTLTPAADWKLASLTLNGEDVTEDVADNTYTLKGMTEDANLAATYEYAHEVEIIETTGIVSVENHDYTVSSSEEFIKIENLLAGDTVKVYTVNGMAVAQMTATQDTMEISLPKGQVYVVMINGAAVKVMH